MESRSRSTGRLPAICALLIVCVAGCGPQYEKAPYKPHERAAPDTFNLRSLIVKRRERANAAADKSDAVEVAVCESFVVEGKIEFLKGQPFPPKMLLQIVKEKQGEGERPVMYDSDSGQLGNRTTQGTPFSATLKAPSKPGEYKIWLMAQPPKPVRKQPQSTIDRRFRIFAEWHLNVAAGD